MNTSSGTCGIISKGPPFVSWSSRSREEVGKEKISTGNNNGKLPKCGDINFQIQKLLWPPNRINLKKTTNTSCAEYEQPDSGGCVLRGPIPRTLENGLVTAQGLGWRKELTAKGRWQRTASEAMSCPEPWWWRWFMHITCIWYICWNLHNCTPESKLYCVCKLLKRD